MNDMSYSLVRTRRINLRIIMLAFLILFNLFGIISGNIVYDKVIKVQIDRSLNAYEYYKSTFDFKRLEQLQAENVKIKSSFGYNLSGTYIPNPVYTGNTVIVLHGFRGTRWESMKYADMYLDLGYNVLIYDSRYHGKSGGSNISMGYFEKIDLDSCVRWVQKKNPNGIIGVHGESLGGATALLHSEMNEKSKVVKFYIVDCPYSDLSSLMDNLLREKIKAYHPVIGRFLNFYTNLVLFFRSGFTLHSISPINAIRNVETPIMFIHGADDEYIPPEMSIEMYRIKKGPKAIYIAPHSGHAQAYLFNKEEYREKVKDFLKGLNILVPQ